MLSAKPAASSHGGGGEKVSAEKESSGAGGGGGLGPRWPKGLWDNSDGKEASKKIPRAFWTQLIISLVDEMRFTLRALSLVLTYRIDTAIFHNLTRHLPQGDLSFSPVFLKI